VRDGGVGLEKATAVGERVRRDVDDPHDRRPRAAHPFPVEHRYSLYGRSVPAPVGLGSGIVRGA
jgi:hypothetical protein